jgi:hypothetical protein
MLAILILVALAAPQDARRWGEAVAYDQKFGGSKDAGDRTAAVKSLGDATGEKTDKICVQLVLARLRAELDRDKDGRNEDKISGAVLDASVDALRKIVQKDAVEFIAKSARNKGESPRLRAYLTWSLSTHGDTKDLFVLADDPAPQVQIAAIDSLADREEKTAIDLFFKVLRDDKRGWEAKLSALRGIDRTGDEKVVDTLIDHLGKVKLDEGRLKDDYIKILKRLVGADIPSDDPNVWKAAWTAKKDGKDPEKPDDGTVAAPTEFFGLKTKSTRIIFLLDHTGSMGCPLKPPPDAPKMDPVGPKKPDVATGGKKESPTDVAAREEAAKIKKKYDEKKNETRIDVLKKEFINTLWGLNEKVLFTVIWYEGNPQPWKDHLVPATWPNKLEIIRDTDKIQPSGPTNIWGALEHAFKYVAEPQRPDVFQVDKKGNYATLLAGADTFFLMTDGAHNMGKFVRENAKTPLDACDIPAFTAELRKVTRLRKVVINTICLGSEATSPELMSDPKLMQKIAEETGGEFVHIKG